MSRLVKEYKKIQQNPIEGVISLEPIKDNLNQWNASISGPTDSPFSGGFFELSISIPISYPMSPPQVKFKTRVFHPNVNFKTGEICLDLLKNAWSPAFDLGYICSAIRMLLLEPNSESPLNCDAGNLLRAHDVRGFQSMAKMYTNLYASQR